MRKAKVNKYTARLYAHKSGNIADVLKLESTSRQKNEPKDYLELKDFYGSIKHDSSKYYNVHELRPEIYSGSSK